MEHVKRAWLSNMLMEDEHEYGKGNDAFTRKTPCLFGREKPLEKAPSRINACKKEPCMFGDCEVELKEDEDLK